MSPLFALVALLALLLVAVAAGLLLSRRRGRVAKIEAENADPVDPGLFGAEEFGARGTVVQFSTEYCARCPAMRRTIVDVLSDRPGLRFVHVDLTNDLALARRFNVLQTPTLLLLDSNGVARSRLSGPLSRTTLTDALDQLTGGTP